MFVVFLVVVALARALAKPAAPSPETCALCELVAAIGDHYLESNATVTEVEKKLKGYCSLAGNEQNLCVAFVDYVVPVLAKDAANAGTPTKLCTDFGLCS
jgi:hypothetical protein